MDTRLIFKEEETTNDACDLLDEAGIDYDVLDGNRLLVSSDDMEDIENLLESNYIDFDIV